MIRIVILKASDLLAEGHIYGVGELIIFLVNKIILFKNGLIRRVCKVCLHNCKFVATFIQAAYMSLICSLQGLSASRPSVSFAVAFVWKS